MTIARAHVVNASVTRWYHCITRCVRRAFLLGEGENDRKEWIERRLQELAEIFSLAVGGFSVLDNHLHVLLRLDPDVAEGWSDVEVVRRWGRLFPPRDRTRRAIPVSDDWVQSRLNDIAWVAKARERLQSLSWFMKCLKEPLARLANREEQTRGTFFEGRFKSVAIVWRTCRPKAEPAIWRRPSTGALRVRARRRDWRSRSGCARSRTDARSIPHVKG
jgi:hypothetical protein